MNRARCVMGAATELWNQQIDLKKRENSAEKSKKCLRAVNRKHSRQSREERSRGLDHSYLQVA